MNTYPKNLLEWCYDVTRRYYTLELDQAMIEHLKKYANFKFCKYKDEAFKRLSS